MPGYSSPKSDLWATPAIAAPTIGATHKAAGNAADRTGHGEDRHAERKRHAGKADARFGEGGGKHRAAAPKSQNVPRNSTRRRLVMISSSYQDAVMTPRNRCEYNRGV
jgi:hypothetical protein